MDRYSASAEEREMRGYFFDFHEIGEPPRLTKYPITDLLMSGQDPQSESQKARSFNEGSELKRSPRRGLERI